MKRFGKFLLRLVVLLAVGAGLLWVFGPYEDSDLSASFDDSLLAQGVDPYLAAQEARYEDITSGVQKRVVWAGAPEQKTDWAVLYVHGYSATSEEIRPVPDQVAAALGANLVFTRLAGHGRSGAALAEPTVADWMADTAEALAIARHVGNRVLVVSTSTGGTLMAAAALDPALTADVAGIVMVSPNFGVNNPAAPLLTLPAARYWVPLVAGAERSWEPHNAQQAQFWTTQYPSVAVMPMAALVQAVDALDLSAARIPALFIYTETDSVVRPDKIVEMINEWGGPVRTQIVVPTAQDDPSHHVIAGDILSPGQNAPTVALILDWAKGL